MLAIACEDVTVTPVAVRNVAVTPTDTTLMIGEELKLAAVVTDDAGNRLANRSVTWSTNDNDVISVDVTGEVVAVSSGEAQVTAAVDGRSGTATIRVADEEVATVEIDPPETRIGVGQTDRMRASPRSRSGTLLEGRDIVWSSDQEDIVTVSAAGVITGVAAGATTIKATIDGVEGSASVTVTEVIERVATVDVEPADTSIGVGGSVTLRAIARSENEDVLGGRDVSWSSSDEGVASVDEDGSVTGASPGTATITATIDDVSGTAEVTVSVLPVDRVEIKPRGPSVLVGGTAQLEAVPLSAAGDPLDGRTASWQTSNDAIATVSEEGLVTGVAEGEATITATIEDVSDTTNVTVSLIPVARVEVEPADTSVFVGDTVPLNAIAFDADGNALEGRTAAWTSSDDGVATVDIQGVVAGIAPGEVTITATIEDVAGTATVTVSLVPVHSVSVEPAEASLFVDQAITLAATPLDEDGEALEDRAATSWTSSDESVASVNDQGVVTGVAPGAATITATIEEVPGTATVTVSLVPVHSVSVEPAEASLFVDQAITLAATPLDEDGEALEDRAATSWTSSDEGVASVNDQGVVTGVAPGAATITATIENVPGTATVTVSLVPVHSVSVEPAEASLFVDQAITLAATPLDEDGEALEDRAATSWTSSDEGVASVNDQGVVTGVAPGAATITATIEGVEGTASVAVELEPVDVVIVDPANDSVALTIFEQTRTFTATPQAADGTPLADRTITWHSTTPGDQSSPCGTGTWSGEVQLEPTTGDSTTVTIPGGLSLDIGTVSVWADVEGKVGCATLTIIL